MNAEQMAHSHCVSGKVDAACIDLIIPTMRMINFQAGKLATV